MTAVAYLRVSTDRQAAEDKTSLADQRASIERLAQQLGVQVDRWFDDPGASGATVEGRPGFRALLEYCAAHPRPPRASAHVLVLNASRWGRFEDPEEGAYWRVHLRRLGWVVKFAEGDAEGDAAPIVRAVASLEASTYRRNLMANSRRGKRGAAALGFWVAGRAPIGYRRVVVGSGRELGPGESKGVGERVKLQPNAEEARLVRWMFDRYASGTETLSSLLAKVAERWPGRRWSRRGVAKVLSNPAYLGQIVGGKRGEGERYGCEAAHEPLVSHEVWQACQSRLGKNRAQGRAARGIYMVSGLLRCTYCGEAYVGGGGGSRVPGKTRMSYRDNGGLSGACPGPMGVVARHLVDDRVVEIMAETIGSRRVRQQIERAIDAALERAAGSPDAEPELRAELRRARARAERLVDLVADGTLLPAEAAPKLEDARARLASLETELQRARFERGRTRNIDAERDRLLRLALDFPALVARLEGAARRELIDPWIGGLTFDKVDRMLQLSIRSVPGARGFICNPGSGQGHRRNPRLIVRTSQILPSRWRAPAARRSRVAGGGRG